LSTTNCFENYCTVNDSNFENLFLFSSVNVPENERLVNFIIDELIKTRFDYTSLEYSYETFASRTGLSQETIESSWLIIKNHLNHFPLESPNTEEIQTEIDSLLGNSELEQIMDAFNNLYQVSKHALDQNLILINSEQTYKIGLIGEIFAYLFARDVQNAACLFHKLIPDNPKSFRQGLDLLTVIFENEQENDQVHFWEAKGTENDFDVQRNKIVAWFNRDDDSYLNMAIEAAKMKWKNEYPEKFQRAIAALSRFQLDRENYRYVGSIVYDNNYNPTDDAIRKFNDISVARDFKHFIIFKTEKLLEMLDKVYERLCN